MQHVALLVCLALAAAVPHRGAGASTEGERILRHVDALRNPLTNFSLDIQLTSFRENQSEVWRLRVYGRGKDKSLVEFIDPASEKGKYLLMLRDGLWVYVPNTSRPIRISPLQRLMGDASNGDVVRTAYSEDYLVESLAHDDVDGRPAAVLDLKAKDPDVSYSRVRLWVTREGHLPLQAEYYVSSGKLVKRLFFRELGDINGTRLITKVEIHDAVRPGRRTLMSYSRLEAKQLPEKMFQPGFLGKW